MNQDTICALATANGVGAIGIIRISGKDAVKITNKVFNGKDLEKADSHTVHYGYIVDKGEDEETIGEKIEVIDEVMVSVFHAPRTFTAENSVEISFHGSPHIAKKILEVLVKNGARMARAGEFTMRAFMNGRIDLIQAESIADIISSENEASRKLALNQLKGGVSQEISVLRNDLLNFTSLVELELDFSEEDVEFADRKALVDLIHRLKAKLYSLIDTFKYGNAIKNGIDVAIIGKPNAGKSTLLNTLLKEERAIVSDIAGTTRDTIEEVLYIKGTAFRFIDTAGIRETTDKIEEIGVRKAKEKVSTAKILFYLYDEYDSQAQEIISFVKEFYREDLKIILLHNKADLRDKKGENELDKILEQELIPAYTDTLLNISARDSVNIEILKNQLSEYVESLKTDENAIITNQRHYEALRESLSSILRIEEAINTGAYTELLAYELKTALDCLGEISGEFTNDEVLENIFSKFCIGK